MYYTRSLGRTSQVKRKDLEIIFELSILERKLITRSKFQGHSRSESANHDLEQTQVDIC